MSVHRSVQKLFSSQATKQKKWLSALERASVIMCIWRDADFVNARLGPHLLALWGLTLHRWTTGKGVEYNWKIKKVIDITKRNVHYFWWNFFNHTSSSNLLRVVSLGAHFNIHYSVSKLVNGLCLLCLHHYTHFCVVRRIGFRLRTRFLFLSFASIFG